MSPLMLLHVTSGTMAVLAGMTALFAPKGSGLHRLTGRVFVIAMLLMAGAGTVIAWQRSISITVLAGVFTGYLVLTSWLTIRSREHRPGPVDIALLLPVLGVAVGGIVFGLEALRSASGLKGGYAAEAYFFFAGMALLAAALDGWMLVRGRIAGRHRLARHLWRMGFALYIANGSLFTGPGVKLFPEAWRGSALLSVPEALVALMMLFWLGRLLAQRFWPALRRQSAT